MNKREAAIVSAYTGILIGEFGEMHKYIEEIMGRPVWTHEMPYLWDEIKARSKDDFLSIKITDESTLAKWYKPDEKLPEKSGSYICVLRDFDGFVYQCDDVLYLKDHPEAKDGWYEQWIPEYGHIALDDEILCWLQLPELPEGVVLS